MSGERLFALAIANIPQLGGRITGATHKGSPLWRQGQSHHIPGMTQEGVDLLARLNVPEPTGHITRASDDLVVIQETAARQVPSVSRQFTGHAHVALPVLQTVNAANVVQPAAGHKATGRCIGTSHDPGRAQWDRVHLVGRVRVPHNQFAVL